MCAHRQSYIILGNTWRRKVIYCIFIHFSSKTFYKNFYKNEKFETWSSGMYYVGYLAN